MFGTTGWRRFKAHDEIKRWANAARKFASGAAQTPALKEKWLQCEGTWYVGVDVLPSDEDGRFEGIELAGPALRVNSKRGHKASAPRAGLNSLSGISKTKAGRNQGWVCLSADAGRGACGRAFARRRRAPPHVARAPCLRAWFALERLRYQSQPDGCLGGLASDYAQSVSGRTQPLSCIAMVRH